MAQSLQFSLSTRRGRYSSGLVTLGIDGNEATQHPEIKFQTLGVVLPLNATNITDEFRIALVQAILFNWGRNKSTDRYEGEIYISKDNSTVNVPRPKGADSTSLRSLSVNFKRILSSKMKSEDTKSIAKNFCDLVKKGDYRDIKDALKHPLFWSSAQKIALFKKSLVVEKNKKLPGSKCTVQVMTGGNWIEKLVIEDRMEIEDHQQNVMESDDNGSLSVASDTIKLLALSNEFRRYDGESWEDFLRFFRNIHAHFWEQDDSVQCCFHESYEDGYWEFFSQQFPGLFMKVYEEYKGFPKLPTLVERRFLPDVNKK